MKTLLSASLLAGALALSFAVPANATVVNVTAIMNADGTLEFGKNVASSTLLSTGDYEIITKGRITKCAVLATLGNPTSFGVPNGTVTVVQRSGSNGKGFFVVVRDITGAVQNAEFTLHAACVD